VSLCNVVGRGEHPAIGKPVAKKVMSERTGAELNHILLVLKGIDDVIPGPNQTIRQPLHRLQRTFLMINTHTFQASLAAISGG
jgi:hypothetical protein